MGIPEFHKARAFGVLGDGTLKAYGSELGKVAAGWAHGMFPEMAVSGLPSRPGLELPQSVS